MSRKPLSRLELQLISEFLSDASEEFSEHGSNDFAVQATDVNRAILAKVLEHRPDKNEWGDEGDGSGWEEYVAETLASTPEIYAVDYWVMDYLAQRCLESGTAGMSSLSPAELDLAAQMLCLVRDGVGPDDEYTLPEDSDGKELFQAIVANTSRDQHTTGPSDPESEKAELALPFSVLLGYLANKCADAYAA